MVIKGAFLADASAKALAPSTRAVKYTNMVQKQEKLEMDDFEEKKGNFGSKGKLLKEIQYLKTKFLT